MEEKLQRLFFAVSSILELGLDTPYLESRIRDGLRRIESRIDSDARGALIALLGLAKEVLESLPREDREILLLQSEVLRDVERELRGAEECEVPKEVLRDFILSILYE